MAHRLDPFAKAPRISISQQQSTSRMDLDTDMDKDMDTPTGSVKRRKSIDSSPERRTLRHFDVLAINVKSRVESCLREVIDGKGPKEHAKFKDWVMDIVRSSLKDVRSLSEHIMSQNDMTNELVNSLQRENQLLHEQNKLLKSSLSMAQSQGSKSNQPTYAAAVSGSSSAPATNMITNQTYKQSRSTTVRMADKTATETAAAVKSKIKHIQKDVRATVAVVGQNVRVSCEHRESLDKIKEALKDDKTMTTDRTMLKPQVKVVGIDQFDAATFVNTINEYNDGILGEHSQVATTIKFRDKIDVVIETTGAVQQRLLAKGSLLHGFANHRVYEHLQLRQCVKCLGLGHKKDQCKSCWQCLSSNCKDKGKHSWSYKQFCFKCAGIHVKKECKAVAPRCAVCLYHGRVINGKHTKDHADHVMLGKECPLRVQGEQALRQRTDYG